MAQLPGSAGIRVFVRYQERKLRAKLGGPPPASLEPTLARTYQDDIDVRPGSLLMSRGYLDPRFGRRAGGNDCPHWQLSPAR